MDSSKEVLPVPKMWPSDSFDCRDGNGIQQTPATYMVLHRSSYDLHKASPFGKGGAAPTVNILSSRLVDDDEIEGRHGET